jgi:hypothetical protein
MSSGVSDCDGNVLESFAVGQTNSCRVGEQDAKGDHEIQCKAVQIKRR